MAVPFNKRQIGEIVQQVNEQAADTADVPLDKGNYRNASLADSKGETAQFTAVELHAAIDIADTDTFIDDVEGCHLDILQASREVGAGDALAVQIGQPALIQELLPIDGSIFEPVLECGNVRR